MRVHAGILTSSLDEFQEIMLRVAGIVDCVHVDFADGVFADNKLVDVNEISVPDNVECEAHIMVEDYRPYVYQCLDKDFKRVIIHKRHITGTGSRQVANLIDDVHQRGCEILLAYEIVDEIKPDEASLFDGVQFMTVPLGFSGSQFNEMRVADIRLFHLSNSSTEIQVDGGINDKTIMHLKDCGVTRVVSTSWLSLSDKVHERYTILTQSF